MTKVVVELKQEEKAPVQALDGAVIKDARGRTLVLREVDFLDESRLVRALGSDASLNAIYMHGYVMPAAMVASIDGEDCILPMSPLEIDAAIQRLGREGNSAVLDFMQSQSDSREDENASLKNS